MTLTPEQQQTVISALHKRHLTHEYGLYVVVTGGRDYQDETTASKVLWAIDELLPIYALINGGATGADSICARWAQKNGCSVITITADWNAHGKAAGPIRNQQMIDEYKPDLAVAFPGGRGTADMVRRLEAAGVPLVSVTETP